MGEVPVGSFSDRVVEVLEADPDAAMMMGIAVTDAEAGRSEWHRVTRRDERLDAGGQIDLLGLAVLEVADEYGVHPRQVCDDVLTAALQNVDAPRETRRFRDGDR